MDLTFLRGTEITHVKVTGKTLTFYTLRGGIPTYSPLEGLNFSIVGIVKEFPDLEGKPVSEIKREAVRRLKEHISKMNSEEEIKSYLKEDLEKHGYKLIMINKPGFRPIRVR